MKHKIVQPGDDTHAAERVVQMIEKYALRFDPMDSITFYSVIIRRLAPIRAQLQSQVSSDIPGG